MEPVITGARFWRHVCPPRSLVLATLLLVLGGAGLLILGRSLALAIAAAGLLTLWGLQLLQHVNYCKLRAQRASGAVFVTGAARGIGKAIALHLIGAGFDVYAAVRKEADGAALVEAAKSVANAGKIVPVVLDVRDRKSLQAAYDFVSSQVKEAGLVAFVSNAGVNYSQPMEYVSEEKWRDLFDVNVFGAAVAPIKFLPLLRKHPKSRVIAVSSVANVLPSAFLGPYSASKRALEGVFESLYYELYPEGISVSIVQPGFTESDMLADALKNEAREFHPKAERLNPETSDVVEQRYLAAKEKGNQRARQLLKMTEPAIAVAYQVEHAIRSPSPRLRYHHTFDVPFFALSLLPDPIKQKIFTAA